MSWLPFFLLYTSTKMYYSLMLNVSLFQWRFFKIYTFLFSELYLYVELCDTLPPCLPAYTSTKTFLSIKFPHPTGVVELFQGLKTYLVKKIQFLVLYPVWDKEDLRTWWFWLQPNLFNSNAFHKKNEICTSMIIYQLKALMIQL